MKSGNLLLGLVACAALCACTDNDIVENGGGGNSVFTGDKAYMVVKINDVGSSSTRGTGADPEFSTGTEHEVDAKNVHFYFYGSDGSYITESTEWTDGEVNTTEGENVEVIGTKYVVITGLTNQNYPSYVVTVINQPAGFSGTNSTLSAMLDKLSEGYSGGIYEDEDNTYFTMSTSSYYDSSNTYYYATPITSENITADEAELEYCTPVNIYVERLAAKVELKSEINPVLLMIFGEIEFDPDDWGVKENDFDFGSGDETSSNLKTLPHTMAYKNTKSMDAITRESMSMSLVYVDGKIAQNVYGDETDPDKVTMSNLFIRFHGWALNATAKQSYMMKHIDTSWEDDVLNFEWNHPLYHRSYWGKSYNYGLGTYPTSSSEINEESDYLTYISADGEVESIDDDENSYYAYCAENTNTAGDGNIITSSNSSAITSVLLFANVFDDDYNLLDLVRCNGKVYTLNTYLAYALNHILSSYGEIYVRDEEGNYTEATISDFTWGKNGYDGYVKVVPASDETVFYSDEDGTTIDDIQEILDNYFNNVLGVDANGYEGGKMYYNIPIQHFNNDYESGIQEANYGVVRNHYYVITLTGMENLGRGIIDPEEPIIPVTESETYYIGADIDILSWKLVEQSVSL